MRLVFLLGLILLSQISSAFSEGKGIFLKEGWYMRSSFFVKQSGEWLSSNNFVPDNWYPLNLPSTVLSALVKNGVYPDPYFGMNNMMIPDASEEFSRKHDLAKYSHLPGNRNPWTDPYWFWTQFELPENYRGKVIWLNLEGINYRAEIWLNEQKIAGSKDVVGMFGDWTFNVTDFVKSREKNTLAVKIYPLDYPGLPGKPQFEAFGSFGLNGGPTGDIGKNVTMQCSVGWDWIPAVRDRNMGIWQDVYISATGPVDIRSPFVTTDLPLPSVDHTELKVTAELVNLTDSVKRGEVIVKILPKNCEGREILLQDPVELARRQVMRIQFDAEAYPELCIKKPNLWWPNGRGKQNLYEIELAFELDGDRSDLERRTFGIREIDTKVTEEGGWARREFFINGKKIGLKGGAWVPDMMLNRDPQKLSHELRFSAEANLNTVRIWGGGMTPPDEFFSLCDELGLLVWHDFWITGDCQGTWDKGSQDYPFEGDVFLKNAEDVVKRLRNHPSLLLWTAGNEGYPRKDIYVPLRNEVVAKLDGTRPFIPSSGYRSPPEGWGLSLPDDQMAGTYSGGPYYWVDPREYYKKVAAGKDWLFKNEVGLPALPVLESLKKFIPDLKPDKNVKFPLNHAWGYHDACEGNGKYSLYDEAIRRRYGEPEDLADYVLKAQLVNAESYRAIFEAVSHDIDRVGGVLLWKTNPSWPSVIWQLYDWYLCPHAGYYHVKNACEPLHIQLNLDDHGISVVNNLLLSQEELNAAASLYSLDMKKVWSKDTRISINPASSLELFKLEVPEKEKGGIFFLALDLKDKNNNQVSENFYWLAENDDFTALSELPGVNLKVDVGKENNDEKTIIKLRFFNPSSSLAFFVHPSIRKGKKGGEVLPSFWSDNYFSLLPGCSKEVRVEFQRGDLGLEQAYLKLEGWNVVPQLIKLESSLSSRCPF